MKSSIYRKIVIGFLIILGVLYLNTSVLPTFLVYNRTTSLPLGVYVGHKQRPLDTSRGSIGCYPYHAPDWAKDRKYLPESYIVCKRILGVAGDLITTTKDEVVITQKGTAVKQSYKKALFDSKKRPLPSLPEGVDVEIPEGMLYMGGDGELSLDSRYTGLVHATSLLYTVTPLFISKTK